MAGDPVDPAPLRSGPRGDEAQKAKGTPQGAEDGIGPVRRGVSAGAGPGPGGDGKAPPASGTTCPPAASRRSTFGEVGLNCRVRNGIG